MILLINTSAKKPLILGVFLFVRRNLATCGEYFHVRKYCEGVVSMADNIDEIIPPSSTELVSLNTRVPRFVDSYINQSVGMIQTASRYQKVSKQMAIQILL